MIEAFGEDSLEGVYVFETDARIIERLSKEDIYSTHVRPSGNLQKGKEMEKKRKRVPCLKGIWREAGGAFFVQV